MAERLDATPAERGGGDHTDETALRLSVVGALRRLTTRQRAVVVLRHYEDLTEAQVAEVLGCSVGTVKRHGHEAVRRLRNLVPELLERTPERSER
ncbi:sigma-70 family RNA polymerase sigma factor [Micromonospora aurantiaca (nom. illeg.)]|uniref:sigma-70 family RNA polymerase sigma factor n=1 Tax=Micromonospora aurantiaca (nom. illeg.) TaxID=47850 RepID=UPI0001BF426B|nr:sigma-70 family RNA polymerase sigma factor [Micromonospora aurantiaca]